jgi:DNA primase
VRLPSNEQRAFFGTAASRYHAALAADINAQGYLMGRGFGPEVAARFQLGVVTSPLVGHEIYTGRLAIPYLGPTGGVVNFSFRCLKNHDCKEAEGHQKYLALEGVGRNLYNVADLHQAGDFVCVAEGELDTITLSIAGLPAVGVPGVENWQDHFGRTLEDFSTIYSFADPDKAGRKLSSLLAREIRARSVRLPQNKDVNEYYREHGADGLRGLLTE